MTTIDPYAIPEYEQLRECLQIPNMRAARVLIERNFGHLLTEQEQIRLLQEVQKQEFVMGRFLDMVLSNLSGLLDWGLRKLSSGADWVFKDIARRRSQLSAKVKEVQQNVETPHMPESTLREIQRRVMERLPQPTDAQAQAVTPLVKDMVEYDDRGLSARLFVHKWLALTVFYALLLFALGIGSFPIIGQPALAFVPTLAFLIDDLLYQMGRKEYITR